MLPGPESRAGSWVRVFGLSGQTGKREAEESGARRRKDRPAGLDEERTGDIAHLDAEPLFRFLFAVSSTFVFYSPPCLNGRTAFKKMERDSSRHGPAAFAGSASGRGHRPTPFRMAAWVVVGR